jgi:hypothetical protein
MAWNRPYCYRFTNGGLQTIVSRNVNITESAAIVWDKYAGESNVIPENLQ